MFLSQTVKKSLIVSILPLALTACALSSCKAAPSGSSAPAATVNPLAAAAADPARVIAKVNDLVITRGDLERAKKIVMANKPGLTIPPVLYLEFETQTLNQLISTELLYQESRKLEIKDLDQQVKEKMAQIRKGFPRQEDFERELKKISLDEKGLEASTRRDLAIAYLINTTIASKVEVSEDEVKKFYQDNPDKFKQPEMVRASHILIGVNGKASAEVKKAAREQAEKLRRDLAAGADFAKLAREVSSCPSGKQGGELGLFPKGKMDPVFEKAAFELKPGSLSEVVETPFGYHIIKVAERKKAADVPLAAAKDKIKDYLRAQKISTGSETLAAEARKSAKVEVML